MKTHQKGRSMVEMLGVLAIIAVLSAGGLAGYSKAMYKIKMNKTIEQISTIAVNVQMLAANDSQHSMTDQWLHENALTAGFVPQEMIKDGKILSPFKNEVKIANRFNGDRVLQISIINISSSQICADLNAIDWSNTGASVVYTGRDDIQAASGDDWKNDGWIGGDEFVASVHGSSLNFPVPASVYAPICNLCNKYLCVFEVLYEL